MNGLKLLGVPPYLYRAPIPLAKQHGVDTLSKIHEKLGTVTKQNSISLETLWAQSGFKPNSAQEQAIRHINGPLYMPAGPGSGKTRVILWRTVNLIVFQDIPPDQVFLSTFTEKAAFQLREGLRALLSMATVYTDRPYDISRMYVGTVHSLCQKLIMDRRFYKNRQPTGIPTLLDELAQYFYLSDMHRWKALSQEAGFDEDANAQITLFCSGQQSLSRHAAVSNCIQLFNRLSEECFSTAECKITPSPDFQKLLKMYDCYQKSLFGDGKTPHVDFSILQSKALDVLNGLATGNAVFKHVIVDEYQDTNTIQEKLFFRMAGGSKNIAVVGDDDQALYRFRGATVENFVQFPERCKKLIGVAPREIPLATNYRSRRRVVNFYTDFISRCNWQHETDPAKFYRVTTKNITAYSSDDGVSVIASTAAKPDDVCEEIATFVKKLIETGKVQDPNQIAFLFPSFKFRGQVNTQVQRMKAALERKELLVYAPRAGSFLEVDESVAVFGVFLRIFGKPAKGNFPGTDYANFHAWLDGALAKGEHLIDADPHLKNFVADRQAEIARAIKDYQLLTAVTESHRWKLDAPYDIDTMKRPLYSTAGLSDIAKKTIASGYFESIVRDRIKKGTPFWLGYVIKRATSLDWNVLDLFYRICGFDHFKKMFDLAEIGQDEGPICNLGLLSQYLARYMDQFSPVLTASHLAKEGPARLLFMSYLFALYRLSESEYENANDPFPKGRIPFLTIHQAKGLEFPVVVLGNPRKADRGPQEIETIVKPLLNREGEPLGRMTEFDIMRMFYVALSRAKSLLVIAHYKGQGNWINEPFKTMLDGQFPRIPKFDLNSLPAINEKENKLPENYSYTSDYLLYKKCPRQYMIFRKYGFVPSRSQTMLFGSLVHKTLEDLHHFLIDRRSK